MGALRDALWEGVRARVPDVARIGDPNRTLANTLTVAFGGAEGETVLIGLDLAGVAASSGSACTSGSLEPSHVLLAMGLGDAVARSVVRLSVGHATTAADIEHALAMLPDVVARARREEAA